MANVNKVMILGNVTRDIELRYTPKGTAIADIGIAINRKRNGDNGEVIEDVTFVDVTLWGRTAEVAHQYSGKGKQLFIEGRLHLDTWDDKETGAKRSKLKVVAENLQLIGYDTSKKKADPPEGAAEPATSNSAEPTVNPHPSQKKDDEPQDDIPF